MEERLRARFQGRDGGLDDLGQGCVRAIGGGIEGRGDVFDEDADGVVGGEAIAGEFDVIEAAGEPVLARRGVDEVQEGGFVEVGVVAPVKDKARHGGVGGGKEGAPGFYVMLATRSWKTRYAY